VRGAHPHVIVYGEGWKMYSFNQADRMAHMQNKQVIYTIGFFNDRFRETIKGKTFDLKVPGFATGSVENYDVLKEMILGSARNRYMFKYTSQSINYVECHDNNTFFDKAITMDKNVSVVRKQALLAIAMVLLSQGVPFLHAGQEFFRTKQGVENSYVSGDVINKFDWRRLDEFYDDVLFVQRLIALRKSSDSFKLKSSSDLLQYADVILLKSGTAMYNLTDGTDLMILFKPNPIKETILIPESYDLLLASTDVLSIAPSEVELNDIGTYVFQRQR
jgi:pullulanase